MKTLAVKYRPKSFEECVGQPTIVSILSRQIETNKFKNAYLFVGPSGCGKTSVARIMSNQINNNQGEPIEIDGASNNGVDNIRSLIIDAQQTSLDCDYKVYIIDECHMLTNSAWNAALKLIEEPPSNAIFIFCTTNPMKIPDTIMSRVQRFDFKRVSKNDIFDRLEFICNEELYINYDKNALEIIASQANGFMREAISLLDKCIDYSNDLSLENVEKVLGLINYDLLIDFTNNIHIKNLKSAFIILDKLKTINSNNFLLFDNLMSFFIDCVIFQKTLKSDCVNIPKNYTQHINLNINYRTFVERLFKYRQLLNDINSNDLLNIFIMEMCKE